MNHERLLSVEELGEVLGRSPETIKKDLRRNPDAVPPRMLLPNTRLLRWRATEVSAWLDGLARDRDLRLSAYRNRERRELTLHPTLASENFQFLREAILAGLGVGLVPDYVVEADVANERVVTALKEWRLSVFGTRMFLLRMPGRYQTLATRTLIDYLIQEARNWSSERLRD